MNDLAQKRAIWIGCLCALGSETLFGLSYVFTKNALDMASPIDLLAGRFIVAFLAMRLCIAMNRIRIDLKLKDKKSVALVALCNPVLYFLAETFGIAWTTASESGAFLAGIPIASLLASALILKKKPNRLQLIGICITLCGVLWTVFAVGMKASFSVIGYAMLFAGVVFYALYGVFVEKLEDFTSVEITYIMIFSGAVFFAIFALIHAWIFKSFTFSLALSDAKFILAVIYQGVGCSILAFFMSNHAIAKLGMNRLASFIGIATVVSILSGVIFLKEDFSKAQILGALLIISGVYVANYKQ